MKTQSVLGVFSALSASLCCITPVLAVTTGTSSLASSLHWTEPFRPYFVGASILILGFAWFRAIKPQPKDECGCEPKRGFLHSKTFLGIVTLVSAILIAFPSYSGYLVKRPEPTEKVDQTDRAKLELPVRGMTCTSCEVHIESSLKKLSGVFAVRASYSDASAKIEYDPGKITRDQLVSAINDAGYSVGPVSPDLAHPETCSKETCGIHLADLPKSKSKSLVTINSIEELRSTFNKEKNKSVKFVAILSSTCKWCIQGAQSVNKTIIESMKEKNIDVIIVWTNMLDSDEQSTAQYAASVFDGKGVTQFFDRGNQFGDIVAKAINPKGEKAWDIYLFFDGNSQWNQKLPRPFEYVHQLGPSNQWADPRKYFCGEKLTERLSSITKTL